MFVERSEVLREVEQVRAKAVWAVPIERVPYGRIECQQANRKRAFLRRPKCGNDRPCGVAGNVGAPEDAADSGVSVLKVRSGVAVEGQHAIPVEHVVLDPVGGQIGVLHGANADGACDCGTLGGRQFRAARIDGALRAFDGFVEQFVELEGFAATTLEDLAVVAEHVAECNMYCLTGRCEPAGHLTDREDHGEMLRLWCADHVHHSIDVQSLDTVDHARQIGCRVVVSANRVLHDERQWLALTIQVPGREHHLRAVALL